MLKDVQRIESAKAKLRRRKAVFGWLTILCSIACVLLISLGFTRRRTVAVELQDMEGAMIKALAIAEAKDGRSEAVRA